jgi:pre-rRNA-processing protein TSR4
MCGQLFTKLQRCSKCKQVSYCCREHQVAHWKLVHKLECQGQ